MGGITLSGWFVLSEDGKLGPFGAERLKHLARSGELRPNDMIWREGLASPVPASRIRGLFLNLAQKAPSTASDAGDQREAEDGGPPSPRTEKKILIFGIGIPILAGICILFAFLWFRDTWEVDHIAQITSLSEQAAELNAHGDLAGASNKLHEILAMVGDRNIQDPSLGSIVADTRAEAKEVDRSLVLQQLPKRLKDAADLLSLGKFEQARAGFQSVLDAVQSQGTSATPEGLRAAERAKEGLAEVQAGQAAASAQQAAAHKLELQQIALADQQREEAARNAKIEGTVSGGAWIIKKTGSSDLLRGMKVYLLKPECSGTTVRQAYEVIADSAKSSAEFWHKDAQDNRNHQSDEFGIYKEAADKDDAKAKSFEDYSAIILAKMKNIPLQMDVADAYKQMCDLEALAPDSGTEPLGATFANVVKDSMLMTAQVTIDGKYSFDNVRGGAYYLYAFWETSYSNIEWLIPVEIKASGAVSKDLFNDTANNIWNKPD
jgi:hypothetical protein